MNHIKCLQDDTGAWQDDPQKIKELVVDYYQHLFSEECATNQAGQPRAAEFPSLSPTFLRELEKPFTREDVQLALQGMHPYKAPGPDGFQAVFFQRYWHIVEGEVCSTVLRVLQGSELPEGMNNTYITLIPKVPNLEKVTQLRPIGLFNVAYKLVTKCIVNRLKRVLPELISPMQSSFI